MELKKVLQGDDWLGHPLHPALVVSPIGMWGFSVGMDMLASLTKNECMQEAADLAVTGGLMDAGVAAMAGVAEFARVPRGTHTERLAVTHGSLNAAALGVFMMSAILRHSRRAAGKPTGLLPKLISLAGMGLVGYTGWLGGGLAYRHGIGVQIEKGEQEARKAEEREKAAEHRETEARAHA